jgi:predicted membrane-bound mannosyltransferase
MKKFKKHYKVFLPGLVGVLALAFAIRIYHLTILPVFADEAIYIRWSQIMVNEPTLRFLPLSDGKQPLFMWVLMFLVRRFPDPLWTGRMVSVMTGLGIVTGVGALSYLLFGSAAAALASALLWAVSPFGVFFDRMALVDSMLAMWILWTLFFGALTAKTRRFDMAMLTGFALGFGLLTKSPAIFAVAMLPTVWVLGDFSGKKSAIAGRVLYAGFLLGVGYVIALAMYNLAFGAEFSFAFRQNR